MCVCNFLIKKVALSNTKKHELSFTSYRTAS